jgi:hypothetical protein
MKQPVRRSVERILRVDYGFLSRVFLGFGLCMLFIAPSTHDPGAFVAGAFAPWLICTILNTPAMPAGVAFFLVWQWGQTFARALVTLVDGESLSSGIYGPDVARAYWYMLASLDVIAICFRLLVGSVRAPSWRERESYLDWRPADLFIAYIGSQALNLVAIFAKSVVPSLEQQLEQVQYVKMIVLFLLFANVMASGRGRMFLFLTFGIELVSGFSSIFGGFRSVFIVLAVAGLGARVRWTPTVGIGAAISSALLVVLALFWTAIKQDYRATVTESSDYASQYIKMGMSQRFGILGDRALNSGGIDWGMASYQLLIRFAYVDIFGSVIGVQENSPDKEAPMRQWTDALEHVFKPRVLFPGKASLSDTEVYLRLAHGDMNLELQGNSSISVGYMGENFADMGFPGMLVGIFMLGLFSAAVTRWFMTQRLPWMVREGLVFGLLFSIGHDGVEISLPKFIGGSVMYFILYAILVRFALPQVLRWLGDRSGLQQPVRPGRLGAPIWR